MRETEKRTRQLTHKKHWATSPRPPAFKCIVLLCIMFAMPFNRKLSFSPSASISNCFAKLKSSPTSPSIFVAKRVFSTCRSRNFNASSSDRNSKLISIYIWILIEQRTWNPKITLGEAHRLQRDFRLHFNEILASKRASENILKLRWRVSDASVHFVALTFELSRQTVNTNKYEQRADNLLLSWDWLDSL